MNKGNDYEYSKRNFFKAMKKETAANILYNTLQYKDQKRLIKELPVSFQHFLYIKNPMPFSYADFIIKVQFVPDVLMNGMGCLVNQILPYREQISNYVKQKIIFEDAFLLGNYALCEDLLDKIDETCLSFWSLDKRLLLHYLRDGAKEALTYKDKIADTASPLVKVLLSMIWTKIEAKYSLSPTEQNMYLTFNKNEFSENFSAYFKYLILKDHSEFKWEDCMWLALMTSIIDIYEFVIDAITDVIPSLVKEDKLMMKNMLEDLSKKISDIRIDGILNILGKIDKGIIEDEHDNLIKRFADNDFKYVYSNALSYIASHPTDFDVIDVYVKSAVSLREKRISTIGILHTSILYQVIKNYFHFIMQDDYQDVAKGKLDVFGNQLSSLRFGCCLTEKVKSHQDIHHTLEKYSMYSGFELFSRDDYDSNFLKYMKEGAPVFVKQKAVAVDFENAAKMRDDIEAVDLYLDAYFDNPSNVALVDCKNIIKRHDKMLNFIELPALETSVFYSLAGFPHYMVYHFFKKYIKKQRTQIPSELLEDYNDGMSLLMEYFFYRVCSIETIQEYIKIFPNSDSALEERLKILIRLSQMKKSRNKKEYLEEITRIKRRQSVNKRVQKLDQRMIYVDETSLKETELEDVKKQFLVYKETESTLETQQYLLEAMDVDSVDQLDVGELKFKTVKIVYKNYLFRQMFMEIRRQFLTSYKYGLDFYLSTRIRHGTLLNQMRQPFESNRLVTNKKGVDYKDDTAITGRVLGLNGCKKEKVQARLRKFSKEIDDYILFIKNEVIQIQAHDLPDQHPKAIFNFDELNPEKEITGLYLEKVSRVTDYVEFVEIIFAYLWENTEVALEAMRDYLERVKVDLSGKILILENDISSIVGESNRLDGFMELANKARNDMIDSIDEVKKWFYRGKCDDDDFIVRDVIDACMESVSLHRNVKFEPIISGTSNTLLKGEYFRKLSDLFLIFFNNIIDYDSVDVTDSETRVTLYDDDDIIEVTISNLLVDKDIERKIKEVETIKKKLKDPDFQKGTKKDKGSGHIKAYNMIHNMLPYDDNAYDLKVDGNKFVVKFKIATTYWKAYENTYC